MFINITLDKKITFNINLEFKKESVCTVHKSKVKFLIQLTLNGENIFREIWISMINTFSKVFEKIISLNLLSFLNSNNFYNENQFGFRRDRNTFHAVG